MNNTTCRWHRGLCRYDDTKPDRCTLCHRATDCDCTTITGVLDKQVAVEALNAGAPTYQVLVDWYPVLSKRAAKTLMAVAASRKRSRLTMDDDVEALNMIKNQLWADCG